MFQPRKSKPWVRQPLRESTPARADPDMAAAVTAGLARQVSGR
jgi:hypothetical protein